MLPNSSCDCSLSLDHLHPSYPILLCHTLCISSLTSWVIVAPVCMACHLLHLLLSTLFLLLCVKQNVKCLPMYDHQTVLKLFSTNLRAHLTGSGTDVRVSEVGGQLKRLFGLLSQTFPGPKGIGSSPLCFVALVGSGLSHRSYLVLYNVWYNTSLWGVW